MKTNHTEGPWIINEDDKTGVFINTPSNSGAIVRVYTDNPLVNKEQGLANAKLIIAAPDLLDALENLRFLIRITPEINKEKAFIECIEAAKKAIKKATE